MARASFRIDSIDHLVLTVVDLDRTVRFYGDVLGMEVRTSDQGRISLHFGTQKINLHRRHHEFRPHAGHPVPGSADLCLVTATAIDDVIAALDEHGIPVEVGPVARSGARGPMTSVYCRDPDDNLVEICCY